MKKYYVYRNEQQEGPYSMNTILELGLSSETLVYNNEVSSQWVKLGVVPDYINGLVSTPSLTPDTNNEATRVESFHENDASVKNQSDNSKQVAAKKSLYENLEHVAEYMEQDKVLAIRYVLAYICFGIAGILILYKISKAIF